MAATFTQFGTNSTASGTTVAVTLTGVASGSILVGIVTVLSSSVRTASADSGMTSRVSATNATNTGYRIEGFSSTTAGTGSVTVTATLNASAAFRFTVWEVGSGNTSSPIDTTGSDNTSTSTGSPNLANPAITCASGSLQIGGLVVNNGAGVASFTGPSGWTGDQTSTGAPAYWLGHGAATGSNQFGMSQGTSRPYNAIVMSIAASGGGGTSSRGDLMMLGVGT